MTSQVSSVHANAPAKLAGWSWIAGIGFGGAVAALAVVTALRLGQAMYLVGLVPAAVILGAFLLLGLHPWPRWSKLTGGVLALAGSAWFVGVGYWLSHAAGLNFNWDYVPAAAGILAGCTFTAALLFIGGWVYRDAQRRGLNAAAWATVAIIVCPYLIGFIAYLIVVVLRDQRQAVCPGCGCRMEASMSYCIRCGRQTHAACPQCQAPVIPGAAFCGRCGGTLAAAPGAL